MARRDVLHEDDLADPRAAVRALNALHIALFQRIEALERMVATPSIGAAWLPLQLLGDLVNFGLPEAEASFVKDALGFVHAKGNVTTPGGLAVGFVVGQFPPGYRPIDVQRFVVRAGGVAVNYLAVYPSGAVELEKAMGPADTLTLDLHFLGAQ